MAAADGDHEHCWICLDDASEDGSVQLISPCKCPRKVHPQCLARWQLQQAGRHEEKFCRFCNTTLADWKANLTPKELAPEVSKVQPIMVVYFEGQIHRIPVKQGDEGLAEFQAQIRDLFRLPDDVDISLTFGCKEPMSGQHLKLEGIGAFDAAVHCASVAAADRQQKIQRSQSAGDLQAGAASGMSRSASSHVLGGALPPAAAAPRAQQQQQAAAPPARRPAPRSRSWGNLGRAAGGAAASPFFAASLQTLATGSGSPLPAAPTTPPQLPSFRSVFAAVAGDAQAGGSPPRRGGRAPSPSPPRGASPSASPRNGDGAAAGPSSRGSGAAAAARSLLGRGGGGGGAGAGVLKHARFSSRAITELTDVPEADETVAVGTASTDGLSGKFKLTLKAFSRKVARSLSFTQRSPGAATPRGGGGAGGGGETQQSPLSALRAASGPISMTAAAAGGRAAAPPAARAPPA